MYPYGEEYEDHSATKAQRLIGLDPGIQFTFPYYGVVYESLFVSTVFFLLGCY